MSSRLLAWFVALVLRHPGRATAAGLAVMAIAGWSATRIQLADDARALVADGDPAVGRQLEALSEFTSVDSLLLDVDGQGHPEELEPAARAIVEVLLASGRFTDARYEAAPQQQLGLVSALMPRRFLLDPRPPEETLDPQALARSFAATREGLLAPEGILTKPFLLRDPIGSMKTALEQLGGVPGLSKLDATSGRFLSKDGQSLLVVSLPRGNPFAGSDAERTMAVVAAASARARVVAPHVVVRPIGAHRYALDAERLVQRDVHVNTIATLVAIVVIFLVFFRRPRLLLVAFPPLVFGATLAAGVAGALGRPVHGIVLAFAAACLGLAVDYTIYLVTSTAAVGGAPADALPEATRRIGRSLMLAITTTVAGLLALFASRIPAIRQMGLLALGSVGGAAVGALLWVPIILPRISRTAPAGNSLSGPWAWALGASLRRPRAVVLGALVLVGILAVLATRTTVDGDLRHLDTRTAAGEADLAAFTAAFGDATTAGLALVEAPTVAEALTRADSVEAALARAGLEHVVSVTSLAPAPATARSRREAWCGRRDEWVARVRAAAAAQGFRPGAFAAFESDLATLCGLDGEVLLSPEPALHAFARMVGRPVLRVDGGTARLAVPFETDDSRFEAARTAVAGIPGTTIIHRQALNARLVELVAEDLPRLAGLSLLLVAALLFASFRDLRKTAQALAPCLLATATFLGVLALTETPLNIMNLAVFALLNGSGVDYGIMMVDTDPSAGPKALGERAFGVVVASLTTLAGFGSLATARYYAIATIGHAVLLAIGTASLYALVVTPALVAWGRQRRDSRSVASSEVPPRAA